MTTSRAAGRPARPANFGLDALHQRTLGHGRAPSFFARSGVTSCVVTPMRPRRTSPYFTIWSSTARAMFDGTAKPMPTLPPAADDRGVDADQLAAQVDQRAAGVAGVDRRVGLDELLVARRRRRAERPTALTMPEVTVWPTPNGLPIATTKSPTLIASESPMRTAVSDSAGMRSSAMSVPGSVPTSSA